MRNKSKGIILFACLALFVTVFCLATGIIAKPNNMPVYVSDKKVNVQAYNINDENYFKLRDIAMAFQNSEKNFEVLFSQSNDTIYINTKTEYSPVGGEMAPPSDNSSDRSAAKTTTKLYINGISAALQAYNVNYNNYYRLKDLGERLDFSVEYDDANRTVLIDCKPLEKPADPEKPSNPEKPSDPSEPSDPSKPTDPEKPKNKTIMIDAGHGGSEAGSVNKDADITESYINYDVAASLATKLQNAGYDVVMLRKGREETLSLTKRMQIIRETKPMLVVSVHHNATEKHNAYGAEVLAQVADKSGGPTRTLAEIINMEYIKIGQTVRPIIYRYNSSKTGDYYGLLRAAADVNVPAIISEFAFIDHEKDIAKINSKEKLEKEAQALYNAITKFLE